jgi:DNA-directed RNA polymerase beta' subunit
MSIYKELSYDQEIQLVKGIQFSILSPEEIVRSSVVEVSKTDTYAGNVPVALGLFDPRMGILEHNAHCRTCEQKSIFCPGHFGHIVLAKPIFHPLYFENTRKILKCVCFRCSRLLISPTESTPQYQEQIRKIMSIKNLQNRWELMFKLCNNVTKIKVCGDDGAPGCGAKQPTRYVKEGTLKIIAVWKEPNVETIHKEFTAEDVLAIFKRIPENEMEVIGFNPKWNRPEWLISTVIPVPPPPVRPSIIEENGQRREDDLTHKLCDIIKTNNQLRARLEKPIVNEEHLAVITGALQYHYATFLDNQIPGLPPAQQRNGRKLKSVSDRLKKKEGRIRGNLNGKRVDQSARSVITPDPYISLDELGVPVKIAMNLTFPEIVNPYNIDEMKKLVLTGPNEWPGAKDIRKKEDGKTYTLKYGNREKLAEDLVDGDIVNRHLRDGDYVLFNRQPSLHKMSMMCHRVKVMPYQTFRLNVLVTSPYNADFDGDEMNLHAPQSIQTMCELKDFANVPYHIISPKDGKPIIEVVQDTMVGSFRLTKDNVRINDKTFANLQMVNSYFDGKMPEPDHKKTHQYSGRQASSQIMPPAFHLTIKNRLKEVVSIKNGKHVSGIIDKNVFHSMSQGILPVIFHDYNPFEVRRFLDNLQRLVCRWLLSSGFSVGISDLVVDTKTKDTLKEIIVKMKEKAYGELEKVRNEKMENNSIMNNNDYFEQSMINILNGATSSIEKNGLENVNHLTNRMINMVQSGSKGKPTNVAQMIACVGQQNVDGKRVAYGFTDRTLPHYTKYDDGPAARGFVENSFISGLTPQEMFFHAMGGREGLIDTAVKSVTGDTPLIIIENYNPKYITIGEWIDNAMNVNNKDIVYQKEDNMEILDISSTYVPTTDMNGNVSWGEITKMTRHDPSEYIYHIITKSGREVTVVESKSLLIWDKTTKTFKEKETTDVVLGDCVPISLNVPVHIIYDSEFTLTADYIPPMAFIAPIECIIKELVKYCKDHSKVIEDTIYLYASNNTVINSLAFLFNRIGIFGIITHKKLVFKGKWAHLLKEKLSLYMEIKSPKTTTYEIQNDVVLDPIIEIIKTKTPIGTKVYDLTIPSTLNFGLANGLHVYDTSETGYIQRRLVKAMEDAKIYYDQTVRNAAGSIIQFMYGEDGMEGTKIEQQVIPYIDMDIMGMCEAYKITTQDNMKMYLTETAFKEHSKSKEWLNAMNEHFEEIVADREFLIKKIFKGQQNNKIEYPIPFNRLIQNAVARMKDISMDLLPSNMTPLYVLKETKKLIKELYIIDENQGTRFFHILIRAFLSPKQLICKYHLQKETFDYIINEVRRYFKEAIANPGEMVGIIAAQSLGEPATQLTLDSFHVSGTAAAVKATSGVPRLKELLSVSKNIKTPTLKIFLKEDISQTVNYTEDNEDKINDPRVMEAKERVFKVLHQIEITRLVDLLESTEIYWDPPSNSGLQTNIQNDDDMIQIYREFMKVEPERCRSCSCWVLRMKLNKEKLKRVQMTMLDIYMKIYQTYSTTLDCIFADDNDKQLIFHLRLRETALKEIDTEDMVAALKAIEYNIVHKILLKGIEKIKKVSMRQYNYIRYNHESQKFEKVNEWIMDTDGSNLIDILSNPNIDPYRTVTNDVYEIYSVLGIEAARNALNNEIMEVIKESSVNQRHLYLLTDIMTCKGTLMSIDRHGINRGDVGPLAKSSFEETTDMLIKASRFGVPDRMNGVSANIMLGQMPPCGTGDSEILIDEDVYIQLIKDKNKIIKENVPINENDPCSYDVLKMELPLMLNTPINRKKMILKDIKFV